MLKLLYPDLAQFACDVQVTPFRGVKARLEKYGNIICE